MGAVGIFIALAIMPAAATEDYPYYGINSGDIDKDFMQYRCDPPTPTGMLCKFTKLSARKKAKPEDLEKRLSKVADFEKDFRQNPKKQEEDCKNLDNFLTLLQSGRAPDEKAQEEFNKRWAAAQPEEKQDMLNLTALIRKVCEAPTRENFAALIRAEHDKDMRTCAVDANNVEQTFQRGPGGMWVHNRGPEGQCGVIYVTSFERADPKYNLWNYKTRKIVTNKKGGNDLLPCTIFDETEHTYNWKDETFFKRCDYVKSGMF